MVGTVSPHIRKTDSSQEIFRWLKLKQDGEVGKVSQDSEVSQQNDHPACLLPIALKMFLEKM